MKIYPVSYAQVAKPQPPVTPPPTAPVDPIAQAQTAVAQRMVTPPVPTQTAQATQATGRTDGAQAGKSSTHTGAAHDTSANVLNAATNGRGYQPGPARRGFHLDVSV